MPKKKTYKSSKKLDWKQLLKQYDLEKQIENRRAFAAAMREEGRYVSPGISSYKEICPPIEEALKEITKAQKEIPVSPLLPEDEGVDYFERDDTYPMSKLDWARHRLGLPGIDSYASVKPFSKHSKPYLSQIENKVLWYFEEWGLDDRETAKLVKLNATYVRKIRSRAREKVKKWEIAKSTLKLKPF